MFRVLPLPVVRVSFALLARLSWRSDRIAFFSSFVTDYKDVSPSKGKAQFDEAVGPAFRQILFITIFL